MKYGTRDNPEKVKFTEKWGDKNHPINDLCNIPKPFRMLIIGLPHSGKTTSLLRMLCFQNPTFENIWILHPEFVNYDINPKQEASNENIMIEGSECKGIKEYGGIDFVGYLRYIPSPNFWENYAGKRNLLIIDDVELRNFCSTRLRLIKINKILSYTSTHHNLSIIITSQDPSSQLPTVVAKFCNFFIIHKLLSMQLLIMMSGITGISYSSLRFLLKDDICQDVHDSIAIDNTFGSPCRFRYNIATPLPREIEELENNKTERAKKKNKLIKKLCMIALNRDDSDDDGNDNKEP